MTTFVFPGQGSQKKGMGAGLFEKFAQLTAKADEILGYSISELCLRDPQSQLTQTQFTQPALFVVSALSYLNLIEKQQRPDYVAGHSLGEYNALFAAGAFDFETGLRLVKRRGELMSRISGGGMAAVVGLDETKVRRVLEENHLDDVDVANYNAPGQLIISGLRETITRAKPIFEAAGARFAQLQVSGAFHSRHMVPARQEFSIFLRQFEYEDLKIPVVSNVEAGFYTRDRIVELLSGQLAQPVRWADSIQFLRGKGETIFVEVGPGNVLTKLIEKIQQLPVPIPAPAPIPVSVPVETSVPPTVPAQIVESNGKVQITASTFGDKEFKKDYGIKYAYAAGGIHHGISSPGFVIRMAQAGLLAYFGTGGLTISQVESAVKQIQSAVNATEAYGVSVICNNNHPHHENALVDLLLKHRVRNLEVVDCIQVTTALLRYRLKGLSRQANGEVVCANRVLARVTHPDVAALFLSPAPERLVNKLLAENKITPQEADLAAKVPLADDVCIEANSGWHSDNGAAQVLLPVVLKLRDEMQAAFSYGKRVRVGSADGIGTPSAVAAAFLLGADFVVTDTLNQCSVEASLSDSAKDLLEQVNVQDTEYAPAREMFELGAKVRVLKKGLLFPARANKLYELYKQHNSLDEIDEKTRKQLQERYFKRSFSEVLSAINAQQIAEAERNPKHKMALVFKWYLDHGMNLALSGNDSARVDYQIRCAPALGAFNHWSKGTAFEKWRNRHVDQIAESLMQGAAEYSNHRFQAFVEQG
jgi:trans-AT polyketide synthase/acyltransferase/oxidoreductase domain-containing protein